MAKTKSASRRWRAVIDAHRLEHHYKTLFEIAPDHFGRTPTPKGWETWGPERAKRYDADGRESGMETDVGIGMEYVFPTIGQPSHEPANP